MSHLEAIDLNDEAGVPYASVVIDLDGLLGLHGTQFVESAYRLLLVREPEEGGKSAYLPRLRQGVPKVQILAEIASSKEARELAVNPPGLACAVMLLRLSRLPLIGRIMGRLAGVDGESRFETRLRAVEELLHVDLFEAESVREVPADELPDLRALIAGSGLFDANWYRVQSPELGGDADLVDHFLTKGGFEGRSSSEKFACGLYLSRYFDVRRSGINPLVHFLLFGEKEGRRSFTVAEARNIERENAKSVTNHEIHCLKVPELSAEVAVLVSRSVDGQISPYVLHCAAALKRQGIGIILVVGTDCPVNSVAPETMSLIDGLFVRESDGDDFAAWAHILQLHPDLFSASILYLLNDGVFGPLNDERLARLMIRIRNSAADMIGLMSSAGDQGQVQPCFMAFKPRALSSVAFHRIINGGRRPGGKGSAIQANDGELAVQLREHGLKVEVLFDSDDSSEAMIARPGDAGGGDLRAQSVSVAAPAWIPRRAPSNPWRVAFIGPWNYDDSLGFTSRGYMSALWHTEFLLNVHPIRQPIHLHHRIAPLIDCRSFSGNADLVMVHLNPDCWPELLSAEHWEIISRASKVVGVWVSEAERIPGSWYPAIDCVDAIWAPSRFSADMFEKSTKVPVHVVPYCIAVRPDPGEHVLLQVLRDQIGISPDQRVILYCFDGAADLARNNPSGLIAAFGISGLATEGWVLILKTNDLFDLPRKGHRLQDEARETPGVILIDKPFDPAMMDALMNLAAVYASPHCSESFGLTIAAAMADGTAPVATDYGGIRDFLDASCGYLVPCALHALTEDHGVFAQGNLWASVDTAVLAGVLRTAAKKIVDGDVSIGNAARERISLRLSSIAVAQSVQRAVAAVMGN